MSERMIDFMSQCMTCIEENDKNGLHEILGEYHAQDALRFIRAEDPEFLDEIIEIVNN